jgi:hypothetical protein
VICGAVDAGIQHIFNMCQEAIWARPFNPVLVSIDFDAFVQPAYVTSKVQIAFCTDLGKVFRTALLSQRVCLFSDELFRSLACPLVVFSFFQLVYFSSRAG